MNRAGKVDPSSMNERLSAALGFAALCHLAGCATPRPLPSGLQGAPREASVRTLDSARTPIEANWKERLAQPYVYVERLGDYRQLGESMRALLAEADELGIEGHGAPFALFYDDPGQVPAAELRARVCLSVVERPARLERLRYDVLPRAMVVYAEVPGAYSELARSYATLFDYLAELGWKAGTPIREIYLVNPGAVSDFSELRAEVQIPWTAGQ